MNKFVSIYQPVTSPSFYSAINQNKNLEMYKITDKYMQKYAKTACKSHEWDSLPFQEFVKVFMGENTPYNSILITWGTGVGKTCGAVQITESLRSAVQMFNKFIYIIAPANLQQNYKETLLSECSGMRIPPNVESRESYISKTYKFYSYIKFGKLVETIYDQGGIEALLKKFSNCVFVIDEAHNLNNLKEDEDTVKELQEQNQQEQSNQSEDEAQRKLLNTLNLLFGSIKNSKLILLTATPIRNKIQEIISLINLLRLNNNEEIIDESIAFNNNTINVQYLQQMFKGYISYVRGNSQISFPIIEDMGNIIDPYPSRSPTGMNLEYTMKYTKVISCPMLWYQLAFYLYYTITQPEADMFNNNLSIISDVSIPMLTETNIINPRLVTSKKSLEQFVSYNKKTGKYTLHPTGQLSELPIEQSFFLCKEYLPYFSTKLNILLDNILQEGVHYVYSRYVQFGTTLISIACQLFGWTTLHVNADGNIQYKYTITPSNNIQKRCWCGQLENVHAGDHPFDQGHIIVYTGDLNTNQKVLKNLLAIVNSEDNKRGQLCKVFIGSRVSGEGVNYRRLRYVHIFEPWWNNTVLQQVIGRAARNCSHFDLPKEQQNVMVYRYVSTYPNSLETIQDIFPQFSIYQNRLEQIINSRETVDMSMYRLSEYKDLQIAFLTRLLKTTAVDCENNYLWNRVWTQSEIDQLQQTHQFTKNNKTYHIDPSTIKLLNRGKNGSPECEYMNCDYDCVTDQPIENVTDDTLLYSYINVNKQKIIVKINQIIEFIQSLHTPMFNLAQLLEYFGVNPHQSTGYTKFDYYNIFDAITEMLTNQDIVFDWNGMTGRLVLINSPAGIIYSFDAFAKYINDPMLIPEFFKYNNVFTNGSNVLITMQKVSNQINTNTINDYSNDIMNYINEAFGIINSNNDPIIIFAYMMELFDNLNDKLYPNIFLTPFNLFVEELDRLNDPIYNTLKEYVKYYLINNYRTTEYAINTFYISWTNIVGTNADKSIDESTGEIKNIYDWTIEFYCRYKVNGFWEYYKIIYTTKSTEPFEYINFSNINYYYIVQQKGLSSTNYYTIEDDYIREYIGNILANVINMYKQYGQRNAPEQAATVYEYFAPNLFEELYNVRIVNQSRGNYKRDNKIDKRSISTGQVCITATKPSLTRSLQTIKGVPEINQIIMNINNNNKNNKVYLNNQERCKSIELLFRSLDLQRRDGKRWFYMYGDYDFGNSRIIN